MDVRFFKKSFEQSFMQLVLLIYSCVYDYDILLNAVVYKHDAFAGKTNPCLKD